MFQVYVCVHVNTNYCSLQPNTVAKGHCQSCTIYFKKIIKKQVFLQILLLHLKIIKHKQLKSRLLFSVHITFLCVFHQSYLIKIDHLVYSFQVKHSNFHMHLQKTLVIVSNELFYRNKKLQEHHRGISVYFRFTMPKFEDEL